MSEDNGLDYWSSIESAERKELKRAYRRAADAAALLEIELWKTCNREEALQMGRRPCRPEDLAAVRRERATVRAKADQARAEAGVIRRAMQGESAGVLALLRERDAARAEVERQREMARAEVKRLHEELNKAEDRTQYAVEGNLTRERCAAAYRRGAEVMREACALYFAHNGAPLHAEDVRALPIPEER